MMYCRLRFIGVQATLFLAIGWNSISPLQAFSPSCLHHTSSSKHSSCPTRPLFSTEISSTDQDEVTSPSSDDNNDARLVDQTFAELYGDVLPQWLLDRLTECGWHQPTRIQQAALDAILRQGEDVVVQAQTGSGKTLSFLLPILANVDPTRATVQALIVVPSRELGLQVGRVAKRLAANSVEMIQQDDDEEQDAEGQGEESQPTVISAGSNKIMIMTVLQGSQNRRQRAWAWADPPQVVIGTPEELCNMVRYGGIKRYNSIKYLVVDEVDACLLNNAGAMTSKLSSGALHELLSKHLSPTFEDGAPLIDTAVDDSSVSRKSKIARPVSQTRQTIFCSATIPQHRHFMKQCVQNQWILSKNPRHVCLQSGEQLIPPTLDHAYMVCASSEKKLATLRRILQKIVASTADDTIRSSRSTKKVLIFAEPQRTLEEMAKVIAKDLDGLLWKEVHGPEEEAKASAIVAVLRYEDSLSQRAAAIYGFTGEGKNPTYWKGKASPKAEENSNLHSNVNLRVLFSSDLAARGLDIMDISHVIQFDLAPDADTYVHRSGRSGRFGAKGQVVSIITPEQEFVLTRLANKLFLQDNMKCIGRQKKDKDGKLKPQ